MVPVERFEFGWPYCALTFSAPAETEAGEPLTLLHSTALPEITGDFDHFAVDLKRNRLFVSAEVHHSIEVFDLQSGAHLQSVGGFKTPHSIAFCPEKDELLVADGGDSALLLLDGGSLQRTERIQLIESRWTRRSRRSLFSTPRPRIPS